MVELKGAAKLGLILVSVLVLVLTVSVLVNYISAAKEGNLFVVSGINTTGFQTFTIADSGRNVTFLESGGENVTLNLSIKVLGTDVATNVRNITQINLTLPPGFEYLGNFSSETLKNASASAQGTQGSFNGIGFTNVTVGQLVNLTWFNTTRVNSSAGAWGVPPLINTSGTIYVTVRLKVPGGRTIPTNNTLNMTVTLIDDGGGSGVTNQTNVTFYINDTIAPNVARYSGGTRANNTNTTNATNDFKVDFNETNPVSVNLSIGFGNNKTIANRSMTISSGGSTATATISLGGMPDGAHNYTVFVTDVSNNQVQNASTYTITNDGTSPSATLTLPTSDTNKGNTISKDDLTCSSSDATSGLDSADNNIEIEKPTGTKVTHNCGTDFTDTSDVGTYKATFTKTDRAGNSVTKTGEFKIKYAETTGSSGSSSTSASTPSASTSVLGTTTLTVTAPLTAAAPVELPVAAADAAKVAVQKIQVEVTKDVAAADASVEVKALDKIPLTDEKGQSLTALPSDQQPLLKVIQITPSAALSSALKQATITFSLTSAELGGRDTAKVVLARFADGKWTELVTTAAAAKADGSVDFSAVTPGFSVFVVTTKAPEPTSAPASTAAPAGTGAPAATSAPSTTPAAGLPGTLLLGIVAVIVIIVIVVVFMMKRKQ